MTPSALHRSARSAPTQHPPREVWPLLGTIAGTALLMAAVIAWQTIPFDATFTAATATGMAMLITLALLVRLRAVMALPRVTLRHAQPAK